MCARFPAGPLLTDHGEHPDFIIETGAERLGIEVTELIVPPDPGTAPRPAVEAFHRHVIRRAQEMYQCDPVEVIVAFGEEPLRDGVDLAARTLVDIVRQLAPRGKRKEGARPAFSMVTVLPPLPGRSPTWRSMQVNEEPRLSYDLVAAKVEQKNRRLVDY